MFRGGENKPPYGRDGGGGGRGRGGSGGGQQGGGGGRQGQDGKYPNYISDRETFSKFLMEFRDAQGDLKYQSLLIAVAQRSISDFLVHLDDLCSFGQEDMANRIAMNVLGYIEELSAVIDEALPPSDRLDDAIDFLALDARHAGQPFPASLTRRYTLIVVPTTAQSVPKSLRSLRAQSIGTLAVIRGVCIAATTVRPKLHVLTSVCELCAEATFQFVNGDRITPQLVCSSSRCKARNAVGRLLLQYKASRFVKFQELRLQELPADVPKGSIPRSIKVVCEGTQSRIATPGQTVRIIGVFCHDPGTGAGNEAFRASTMVKTQFRASHVVLDKQSYETAADELRNVMDVVRRTLDRGLVVEKLVRSIAPEIWGLEDVKKILLCLLIGGSPTANGMPIRSDINICMMGDPGVAKSQLLKWVATVAPRSVFTTGKGSSGVGLTASVTRDANTGESVLEGGALVLSDRGICCIDEFDKMDETDRTSLHEVMEQQSVSIAKAGIITTLNARTSILAASNPKFGRWKRNYSPSENVALPPALLSRFDVLWLMLDEPDRDRDSELSMHVTYVHLHGIAPGRAMDNSSADSDYFSREFLRAYVGEAKRITTVIDTVAARIITEIYCEMRSHRVRQHNVVTARTLLSLIRISQALARLRLSEIVQEQDVREAGRLLDESRASLQDRTDRQGRHVGITDAAVYAFINDLAKDKASVSLNEIRPTLLLRGVNEEQLQHCIAMYSELGVWSTDPEMTVLEMAVGDS